MFADLFPVWPFVVMWILFGLFLFGGLWCLLSWAHDQEPPKFDNAVEGLVVYDDDDWPVWMWTVEGGWKDLGVDDGPL